MSEERLHFFGIRHHGPGSARSLEKALSSLKPSVVLVEGPPDAAEILALAAHEEMRPPVALLVYVPEEPGRAVFYPFAKFSPEWVAIRYALAHAIPVRFMDLPQANRLVPEPEQPAKAGGTDESDQQAPQEEPDELRHDPLGRLAAIAGYSDGERWWDALVESRGSAHVEVFRAVADAMVALREGFPSDPLIEQRREAFMRQSIRAAMKEDFERIAVVCGAWHVPALVEPDKKGRAKDDAQLLKGLPKVKTAVAWVPWSYDRLSFRSGYGAGIESPEWYHLLWSQRGDPVVQWLTRAARLMRKADMDASSASVIEAVRLAEALAALRGKTLPGLPELDEAALTVMCFGNDVPMQLIRRELVVGHRLGEVPECAPTTPLQQDLAKLQKSLRLPPKAEEKDYDLDLRQPLDLERSHLLHRLNLLDVPWGEQVESRGKKGTFHECWRLQWRPDYVVPLIDAGRWGNTIAAAASSLTLHKAALAQDLVSLTGLLDHALLSDLPDAVAGLMQVLRDRAAVSSDVPRLMAVVSPLARVTRYGNVRRTDTEMVLEIVEGLVARICVGLAGACSALNDDAAQQMYEGLVAVNEAVGLLQKESMLAEWRDALRQLADQAGLHGLLAGRACRLLHDAAAWPADETGRRMSLALSRSAEPSQAAAWIEGFLAGSGLLLVHDRSLWQPLDEWVRALSGEHFTEVLPLLRRTFSTFAGPERRQIGERVRGGDGSAETAGPAAPGDFDFERADAVLPLITRILGLEEQP